jgi:hypothetical protein
MHAQQFDWIEQGKSASKVLATRTTLQRVGTPPGSRARPYVAVHAQRDACAREMEQGEEKGIEEGQKDRTPPIKCLARSRSLMVAIFPNTAGRCLGRGECSDLVDVDRLCSEAAAARGLRF